MIEHPTTSMAGNVNYPNRNEELAKALVRVAIRMRGIRANNKIAVQSTRLQSIEAVTANVGKTALGFLQE